MSRRATITSSNRTDAVLFVAILVLLALTSLRLIVYAHVTPIRISVSGLTATGREVPLETPPSLRGVFRDREVVEESIELFVSSPAGQDLLEPFALLEWELTYSIDSARFDRTDEFTTP